LRPTTVLELEAPLHYAKGPRACSRFWHALLRRTQTASPDVSNARSFDTIRFVMGFEHLLSNRRAEALGHLALVICVGLIALAAVGCGSSDKKWPIVGRWALEGGVIKSVPQFVVYQDDQT
jgi:hypothetical protein